MILIQKNELKFIKGNEMKQILIIALSWIIFSNLQAQRISADGDKFMVNGKEIVMNGANTPWNHWDAIM